MAAYKWRKMTEYEGEKEEDNTIFLITILEMTALPVQIA